MKKMFLVLLAAGAIMNNQKKESPNVFRFNGISQWFQHLELHLGRPALLAPGRGETSYLHLKTIILECYKKLRSVGVTRSDCVVVLAPQGAVAAAAILSVMSCSVCAPLDLRMAEEEIVIQLGRLAPAAVMLPQNLSHPVREIAKKMRLPVLDMECSPLSPAGYFTLKGEPFKPPSQDGLSAGNDLALRLNTAGSVAEPKLISLSQRNVFSSASHIAESLKLTAEDRNLSFLPLFHSHGLMTSLLASISVYSSVACLPEFDKKKFMSVLEAFRPTWFSATPSCLQCVLETAETHAGWVRPSGLRFIRSSFSSLSQTVLKRLEKVFNVPVIEAYGMTEAAHQIASNPLPPGVRKSGSVGIKTGTEIAIIGVNGGLLPPGKEGEILIRGDNVIAHNQPQGSPRNYGKRGSIGSPGEPAQEEWFHTGDQGYLDEDGYLFLTGRMDEFINRGGELISPREVEDVLLEHPAVLHAVAFPVVHPRLGQAVSAAVVLRDGADTGEEELRFFAARRLTPSKAPQQIIFTADFPKSNTGKVRRKELAEKFASLLTQPYAPPRSNNEKIMAAIWTSVFRLRRVGLNDNFFTLGGDSLLATRVHSHIREIFRLEFPLLELFRHPTLGSMTELIYRGLDGDSAPGVLDAALAKLNGCKEDEDGDCSEDDNDESGRGEG